MIRGIAATVGRNLMTRSALRGPIYALSSRAVNWYNGEGNGDERTNGEAAFLRNLLTGAGPLTIFDVGANIGDFARACLAANPEVRLHCFEPCRATLDILRKANLGPAAVLNDFGLGSEVEERTLHVLHAGAGSNSLYLHHQITCHRAGDAASPRTGQGETETVRLSTVDRYCSERGIPNVDFMKIDVEGHELEVLRGATTMLGEHRIQMIQFEYNVTYIEARVFLKDMFDLCSGAGYEMHKIYPDGLRMVSRYEPALENFKYSCYVALLPGSPLARRMMPSG